MGTLYIDSGATATDQPLDELSFIYFLRTLRLAYRQVGTQGWTGLNIRQLERGQYSWTPQAAGDLVEYCAAELEAAVAEYPGDDALKVFHALALWSGGREREGFAAIGLWAVAGSWSADDLTDGWVPDDVVDYLAPGLGEVLAARLQRAGLWDRQIGLAVDAEGAYWCAMFEGQRLLRLSPRGEVLLLELREDGTWEALARPTRRLKPGHRYGPVELLEHLGERERRDGAGAELDQAVVDGDVDVQRAGARLERRARRVHVVDQHRRRGDRTLDGVRRVDWILRQPVDLFVLVLGDLGEDDARSAALRLEPLDDRLERTLENVVGEKDAAGVAGDETFREPDAFPAADVGLLRAMADQAGGRPTPADMLLRAEAWRPWRGYACMRLWRVHAQRSETR